MTVGEKIKKFRLEKHLTQKELGKAIETTQQMIAQYENGKRIPKIQTLQKISDVLEIQLLKLLDDDTYELKVDAYTRYNIVTDELELEETEYIDMTDRAKYIDYYDNFNNIGKKEALKRIEEMSEIKKYTEINKE